MRAVVFAILVACLGCSVSEAAPEQTAAPGPVPLSPGATCEGCGASLPPADPDTAPSATGTRTFGAALDPAIADVPLASVLADPEGFRDRTIRTHGTIVRVCQRMGCWMELADDGSRSVRVPMAGHAFFLPRDVAGRPARIEARVRIAPLSAAAREHLAGEGAEEVGSTLALEATAVAVD